MVGQLELTTPTCFAHNCKNRARWLVNARYREAQSASCSAHLARCVKDLSVFNDPRCKRRASDHGVMIYPTEE
ncbi:hypothetical protein [Streptomyces sp. CC53]|uniref:hypothetical protein n=1 Tax=Streptomyces sp. CC53 TaxID=1906740 RepID=UPI00115FA473|nr:hypothetical protein [Streptomyces sp. CC53]